MPRSTHGNINTIVSMKETPHNKRNPPEISAGLNIILICKYHYQQQYRLASQPIAWKTYTFHFLPQSKNCAIITFQELFRLIDLSSSQSFLEAIGQFSFKFYHIITSHIVTESNLFCKLGEGLFDPCIRWCTDYFSASSFKSLIYVARFLIWLLTSSIISLSIKSKLPILHKCLI